MAHQREPSGSSDQASYADPRMPTKSPLISGVTKKKTPPPPPGFAVIKSQGYVATDVCSSKSQGYITPDVCSSRSQGYIAPDGNLEATSTKRKREINCNKHGTDPDKQFVYGYDSYVSGVHDSGSTDSYPSPPSDNFFNLPSDFDVSSLSTWKTDAVYEDLFDVSNPCITDALHCIPKDNGRIPDNAEDTPNAGSTLHLPKGPESVDLSLEDIQKVEYAFKQNEWDMPSSEQVLPDQLLGEGGTHIGGNDTHSGNRQLELYFQSLLSNVREEDLTNHEESSSRNGSFHQINQFVHRAGNLTAEELGDCSLLTPEEKVVLDMLISKIKQRKLDSKNTRKKSNSFKDATREEVEQRVNSAESRGSSSSTTEHVLATNNKHFPIPEVVRKRSQDDQIGGSLFDSTATTVAKRDHSGTSKNQLLTGPTPSKSAKLQQEQSLKKQKKHKLVSVVNPTDVHEGREGQRFEKQTDDLEDMEIEDFDEKPGADGGLFLGPYSGSSLINLQGNDQGVCEPPKTGKIPSNLLKKKKNKRKSSVGKDGDRSQQRKRNQGIVSEAENVSTMDVTVGTDRDHPQRITEQEMHSTDDKTPQQVVSSWNDNEGGKNAKLGSNEPRSRWIQQHGTLGHVEVNQVTNDVNFKGSLQNQKPHESTLQAEAHNKVESIRSSYAAPLKERCSPPAEVVHKSPKETSVERKEQTYFETDWVVVPSQHKAHSKPANKHSDFTEHGSKEYTGGNRDKIENGKKLRMPGSLDSRSRTRVTKEELKTDMKETHAAGEPVLPPTKRKEQSRKERIKATSLKDSRNNAYGGDDLTGLSSSVLKGKQSQETDNGWQRVQRAEVPSQAATNPGKSSKREERRSKGMKQRERNMSEESCKGEDNGSVSHRKTTFQKRSRSYSGSQKDSQSSDKANAFDYGKATGKEKDVGSSAGKVPSGVKQKHNSGRHGNVDREDKCRDQKTENLTQTGKPKRDSASKVKKEIPHGSSHTAFKQKDQQAKARKDKKSSIIWNDIFFNHLQAMVKLSKEGSIFVICLLQIVGMCLAAHAYATFDYFQYLIMALASDAIDCCQTLVPFIINHFVKHLWPYVLKPIWFVAILLVLIVVLCGKAIYQCLQWLAWCVFRVFSQEGKFEARSSNHNEQFQQDFGSFGQGRDFPNKCNTDQEGTFTGSTFSDMGSHGNSTDNNQGCNSETTDNGYEPGDPGTGNARNGTSNDADEAIRSILNATDGPFEVLGVNVIDTQEVIKKEYRRLAILVHPDKNKHPDAQRAFQILQAAHDKIGDEESRLNYLRENQNIAYAQDVADECERQFEVLRSTIHCECGLFHRMTKTDRSPLFARFCSTHGTYHQAYENDVWTETSCLGLKVHCYLCQSGVVYDATYWASCQKLLGALEPNGCRVRVKIGPTSHSQNNPTSDFEDFMHRFGSAPPRGGRSRQSGNHYPNKKKKNKRSGRR